MAHSVSTGSLPSADDVRRGSSPRPMPHVQAIVAGLLGLDEARRRLGVNSTGLAFDSLPAVETQPTRTANPMVNAGAIATTILAAGDTPDEKWGFLRRGLSAFAGRDLAVDEVVYESESATNGRYRGVVHIASHR